VKPAGLVLAALVPLAFAGHDYALFLATMTAIHGLLAVSLDMVVGSLGLISLGHAALFGIGAYISAGAALGLGAPWLAAAAGAALAGALGGVLLGLLALRIRGHYFVLVTLAFGEIVRLVLLNWKAVTRGTDGVIGIPPLSVAGVTVTGKLGAYVVSAACLLAAVWLTRRVRGAAFGRALVALRTDTLAARAAGIPPALVLLSALAWSGGIAGVAGSLYAHFYTFISPEVFTVDVSVTVLLMVIVGGAGTTAGPLVGAVLLTLLPEWLRPFRQYYLILYGAAVVLVMVFLPGGIVGALRRARTRAPVPVPAT
jgi:branched-chain amino acid transport system permease protein